jgi:hypothetical protein
VRPSADSETILVSSFVQAILRKSLKAETRETFVLALMVSLWQDSRIGSLKTFPGYLGRIEVLLQHVSEFATEDVAETSLYLAYHLSAQGLFEPGQRFLRVAAHIYERLLSYQPGALRGDTIAGL